MRTRDAEKRDPFRHCCWECKTVQPLENSTDALLKTKNRTALRSCRPIPGHDIQTQLQFKKIHTLRCSFQHYSRQARHGSNLSPSAEEWIKATWFMDTMEYYSAKKKNELMPFAATWMDLEIIILSEVKTEEDK